MIAGILCLVFYVSCCSLSQCARVNLSMPVFAFGLFTKERGGGGAEREGGGETDRGG